MSTTIPNAPISDWGTGEFAVVRVPRSRRTTASRRQDTTTATTAETTGPWWWGVGAPIIWTGVAGVGVSLLLGIIYALTTSITADEAPVRVVIVAVAVALLTFALVAIIVGLAVRTLDRRDREAAAEATVQMQAVATAVRDELMANSNGLAREVAANSTALAGELEAISGRKAAILEQISHRIELISRGVAGVGELVDRQLGELVRRQVDLEARAVGADAVATAAAVQRCAELGKTLAEKVTAVDVVLKRLHEVEERWAVPAARVNGHDHGDDPDVGGGGELVVMPNSRAFQLGREVERRRWERLNSDS